MRKASLLLVLTLLLVGPSAQAVEYKVQRLVPADQRTQSNWACAINDKGQIVGRIGKDVVIWQIGSEIKRLYAPTEDALVFPHGINNNGVVVAIYRDRKPAGANTFRNENLLATIPEADVVNIQNVPFSMDTGAAAAINDSGWMAFTSLTSHNGLQGFVVKGDIIATGNKQVTRPLAMNNKGHIAGFSGGGVTVADTEGKPIRSTGGLPGCRKDCLTKAINEHDEAVGYASDSDYSFHAFVFRRDATELIELPRPDGYKSAVANDINDSGLVVGYIDDGSGQKAVAWDSQDRIIELPTLPNCRVSEARGANNAGQIVGVCSGNAVLWTPVEN